MFLISLVSETTPKYTNMSWSRFGQKNPLCWAGPSMLPWSSFPGPETALKSWRLSVIRHRKRREGNWFGEVKVRRGVPWRLYWHIFHRV